MNNSTKTIYRCNRSSFSFIIAQNALILSTRCLVNIPQHVSVDIGHWQYFLQCWVYIFMKSRTISRDGTCPTSSNYRLNNKTSNSRSFWCRCARRRRRIQAWTMLLLLVWHVIEKWQLSAFVVNVIYRCCHEKTSYVSNFALSFYCMNGSMMHQL